MADRTLTWHYAESGSILPAFYADEDYEKVAVRIHADTAPNSGDFEVDIFDDGVSIFNSHAMDTVFSELGRAKTAVPVTKVVLPKGDTAEVDAEDFTAVSIEEGSWLTCVVYNIGGAANVTIHLEVDRLGEEAD